MSHIRGRFKKKADKLVNAYTTSVPFDWRLYPYDIAGSIAHCRMLARVGVISDEEAAQLVEGLGIIKRELDRGEFEFDDSLEDIFDPEVAARLKKWVYEAGGLREADELYRNFRGQDPSIEPLLEGRGFATEESPET